ncbi:MAG: PD-(D/E)XK nuclease family protein [Anaerolineae bacterium]|nr:PD-(D/E)XK nuclease family protein [Anaerolineae bacterium]
MLPKAGQNLLLNNRLWTIRQVHPLAGRKLEFEVLGASPASLGMTRRMKAVRYGDDLFIEQRRQSYWYGHLQQDWLNHELGPALACRQANWLDLLAVHTRHPASGNLKNEFSWSYSRAATYQKCPRAYYYHYYAAWEGWQTNAPAPVKRAYLLKNLTSLPRWVGDLVHETIKYALIRLKDGQPVADNHLVKHMHTRAQADFADSRSGRYRQKPNQLTGFQEHYYQLNLSPAAWQTAWTDAEHYLRTFINSTLYADLCRQPVDTLLEIEALQFFTVARTKMWVQMDLAQHQGNTFYIYDWKTGPIEESDLRQQLGIYGLYARHAWPETITNASLRGIVYALAEDRVYEFELTDTTLHETRLMVETSLNNLRDLLLDPQANLAELRRFPMIDDLRVCQTCQFRELCGRDKPW